MAYSDRTDRYRSIFESAVDFAIIGLDTDGMITEWNTGAERTFGWKAEEICGQPADRFFTPEDRAADRPAVEMRLSIAQGRANDERWHIRKDGTRFWATGEMMPLLALDGAHIGFVKILRDRTEQRRATENTRYDIEFLRSILASSDDCIKVLDLDGQLLSMTEGGMRVMEVVDFEAIRGCAWTDFWTDQGNVDAKAAVKTARAGGIAHFRGAAKTVAGTPKWWDVKVTPIPGPHGHPEKLLVVSRDMTQQRRGEVNRDALLELGDRLRLCTSTSDMAYAAAEVLARTLGTDRAGYGEVELTADTVTIERDWTAPGVSSLDGTNQFRDYGSYIDDLRRGEIVVLDGTSHDARMNVEVLRGAAALALINIPLMEKGALSAIFFVSQRAARSWSEQEIAFTRDAAQRVQASIQRHRAEAKLNELAISLEAEVQARTADRNRLWNLSTDIMLVAGFDGVMSAVNPAWTTVFGWSEDELLLRNFLDLVHPDDLQATQNAAAALGVGSSFSRFENRYRRKDGSYRNLAWTAVPGDGLIIAVARDVTAEHEQAEVLRSTEEALRQAQKVEAIGQLTGGVAHDFNNLLTVIRGSVDLLRRPGLPEERRLRYIDAIADTADRATKLTSQLLAFARRQSLKPEIFEVTASVRAISDMIRTLSGARVKVSLRLPTEPCYVDADRSQFDTAIVNMAVNARDAMRGEGELTIAVAEISGMPEIRSHPAVEGAFVTVSLTDSGSGISAEKIDKIFEPFFTTKGVGEGTGLGLSQVFGFTKQSGGDIFVESIEGEGATFTMYLPRGEGLDGLDAESGDTSLPLGGGACILVVEDNVEVGFFATEALAELGYHTVWAEDGPKALAELAAGADRFDVVFSDVMMPGMSGIELGQEIARLYPALPVVLTSGYSEVLAQNGTHGFELLQKPYSIDALARALRKSSSATMARSRNTDIFAA